MHIDPWSYWIGVGSVFAALGAGLTLLAAIGVATKSRKQG